jgi:Fe-S-cluster containining protein
VTLPYTRIEAMTLSEIPIEDRRWAARSLRPMSPREAYRLAPWLRGKKHRDGSTGVLSDPFFFRCIHFDRETRRCTDYENRPAMCRNYPWYGGEPQEAAALPPTCSFRADIGEVPVAITPKP